MPAECDDHLPCVVSGLLCGVCCSLRGINLGLNSGHVEGSSEQGQSHAVALLVLVRLLVAPPCGLARFARWGTRVVPAKLTPWHHVVCVAGWPGYEKAHQ